jgi:hypothetical protein
VFIQQSTSMSSYPVHRSIPPARRSSSDEKLVPGEAQDKPLSPHANLSLLRVPMTRQLSQGADVILGAFIGGGSAAFAAYLADRRRFKREDQAVRRQVDSEFILR